MTRIQRLILCLMLAVTPLAGAAQERETIGVGRVFNNDLFGDGRDRWRTTSYTYSILRAAPGQGGPQQLLEYRLMGEMISSDGRRNDRPYVGALSAGVAQHTLLDDRHIMMGVDVMALGPQTGLAELQDRFHDRFDIPRPFLGNQLADTYRLQVRAETAWHVDISDRVRIRPFVAARAGVEDLVRAGADVLVGQVGRSDVLLRDDVTGQLYRGTQTGATGLSLLAGADFALVGRSTYLPFDGAARLLPERYRVRAGVHWQRTENASYFYGLTYLSEEFAGQPEGQLVGSLTLNFNF